MSKKVTIDKVYTRPKKGAMPTLLKFQNGLLSAVNKETTEFCRVTRSSNKARSAMLITNKQIYHGLIDKDADNKLTSLFLCVRNKTTNKIRILPIENSLLSNNIYNELEKTRLAKITKENSTQALMKKFGSRKANRYLANQANLNVNIDLVKQELDSTVNDTTITEPIDNDEQSEKHLEFIRPKFNKDAKNINEVYEVHDIVPSDLLERMEEEAKIVYGTDIEQLPISSEYLKSCIQTIQNSTPSPGNFLNIKLILYMDGLSNLVKTRGRLMNKLALSSITEKVENDIRKRFSDPNIPFTRTTCSTEKALCYFIVLAFLISENYQVDITMLTKDLCTPRAKVMKFAHVAMGHLKRGTSNLCLQLPSNVQPLTARFGKRVTNKKP